VLDELLDGGRYDFERNFNAYTDAAFRGIRVFWVGKNVHILGYTVDEFQGNLWAPTRSVEELCALMQVKKFEWIRALKSLGVDLSTVTLARMEAEDEVVSFPEPFMMQA